MQYAELIAELEEIEKIKQALKVRAMIYQVDAKEKAAARDGLPNDAYYNLPYSEWAVIRDRKDKTASRR